MLAWGLIGDRCLRSRGIARLWAVRLRVVTEVRDRCHLRLDGSSMSNRVVCDISISADGYVAGPGQTADKPFGDGPVDRLHAWMFDTPEENKAEADRIVESGAFIMGRNMFGPSRGDWDLTWKGWWGENPPYHSPVFVLTQHRREPLTMQGGTTFTFITDGIAAALDQARQAAEERDVAIAGGAATINQY